MIPAGIGQAKTLCTDPATVHVCLGTSKLRDSAFPSSPASPTQGVDGHSLFQGADGGGTLEAALGGAGHGGYRQQAAGVEGAASAPAGCALGHQEERPGRRL